MASTAPWATATIEGVFEEPDGTRSIGNVETILSHRLTWQQDSKSPRHIIPAGVVESGTGVLNRDSSRGPSLRIKVPAHDDERLGEEGWVLVVRIHFRGQRPTVTYVLDALRRGRVLSLGDVLPVDGSVVVTPTSPRVAASWPSRVDIAEVPTGDDAPAGQLELGRLRMDPAGDRLWVVAAGQDGVPTWRALAFAD